MPSEEFIAKQKEALLKKKAEVEDTFKKHGGEKDENVKSVEDYDVQHPNLSKKDEGFDEDTEAFEVETFNNRIAIEKNLEKSLLDINHALKRIEEGTYGQCDNCEGVEIPEDRLAVLPEARICMDCEQKNKAE